MRPAVQLSKQPRYWYPSPLGAAGDFNGIGRDIGVVIDDKVSDAAVDQSGALRWQRRPARHARQPRTLSRETRQIGIVVPRGVPEILTLCVGPQLLVATFITSL